MKKKFMVVFEKAKFAVMTCVLAPVGLVMGFAAVCASIPIGACYLLKDKIEQDDGLINPFEKPRQYTAEELAYVKPTSPKLEAMQASDARRGLLYGLGAYTAVALFFYICSFIVPYFM